MQNNFSVMSDAARTRPNPSTSGGSFHVEADFVGVGARFLLWLEESKVFSGTWAKWVKQYHKSPSWDWWTYTKTYHLHMVDIVMIGGWFIGNALSPVCPIKVGYCHSFPRSSGCFMAGSSSNRAPSTMANGSRVPGMALANRWGTARRWWLKLDRESYWDMLGWGF